jgi:type IV secretory pathway TraG/TraD family ATPase VirD4
MLNYCWMYNKRTNADVWEVLCWTQEQILKEVAPCFGSEETRKYFTDSKLASNISAVIAGYTTIFKFLPKETDKFNMMDFLDGKDGSGWIFISNMDNLSYMLRPWITLFIDSLISSHLSLPDDYNRRVVYELDEFNTLHGTIGESIHKLAIAGRSKGAIPIIGFQGMGGLEKTLGREQARDVCNAMGNNIFLRVGKDPDTARWMSDVIGETMFLESEISHSSKTGDGSDGTNIRQVRKTEKLVLPSDLMGMPSLHGYINLAEYGTVEADFKYKSRQIVNQGFVPRPDIDYASLVSASQAAMAKANQVALEEVPEEIKKKKST